MASDGEALPDSWDEVDAARPGIRTGITPRDLQAAVEESDTLFEVTTILRTSREEARLALRRLDLLDELQHLPDSRGQRITIGGDEADV